MAAVLAVSNETTASVTRTIKDGRKITYQLNVVQQPERARACGQGAKSSTDRRPIDPPPILDLRIFEGEGPNTVDITVSYKASFFVWASLEQARNIAQGRLPQPQPSTPVLCGTPVAGIQYLERPQPAGYFIFPDLSVRNEGKYRLNFSLYEDLKDPMLEDLEPRSSLVEGGGPDSVTGRLEVKSTPFIVYSAKKFPGLAESTALSRMVADQGCRVRIRRDVRMRRRRNKTPKDWDEFDDQSSDHQPQLHSTPILDQTNYPGSVPHSRAASGEPQTRPRSSSIASNVSVHHTPVHQSPNEWAPPPPPEVNSAYQHTPQFYGPPVSNHEPAPMANYPAPQYSPMAQSPQSMHTPHMSPYQVHAPPTWAYQPQTQMHSPSYGPPVNHMRHASMPYVSGSSQDYHAAHAPPPFSSEAHQAGILAAMNDNGYNRHMHTQSQIYPNGQQTPVASAHHQAPFTTDLPPLRPRASNSSFDRANVHHPNFTPQPSPYIGQPPPPQYVSHMPAGAPAPKRPFGTVFNTHHIDKPLHAGARPETMNASQIANGLEGHSEPSSSDDDSLDLERLKMEYRRADGRKVQRTWPMGA